MAETGLEAIIFDFDGVIVESLDVKAEAFGLLFEAHEEHVDQIVELHQANLGVSRYEKFEIIYRDILHLPLDDAEMKSLDERFSDLVFARVVSCDFVPGAEEFLERASRDLRLYVASATPEGELNRVVEARGLAGRFEAVRGSPATKAQIVEEVLSNDEIESAEAVFIGDALSDYEGASSNAVAFIGRVPDGASDPFQGLEVETVRDLAELNNRWEQIRSRLGLGR